MTTSPGGGRRTSQWASGLSRPAGAGTDGSPSRRSLSPAPRLSLSPGDLFLSVIPRRPATVAEAEAEESSSDEEGAPRGANPPPARRRTLSPGRLKDGVPSPPVEEEGAVEFRL
jgi:hypothetical protein